MARPTKFPARRLGRSNLRSAPPAITPDMVARLLAAVPARAATPAPAPILTLVPKARPAKAAPSAAKATRGERAVRRAAKAEAADRPKANVPPPRPVAAAAPISSAAPAPSGDDFLPPEGRAAAAAEPAASATPPTVSAAATLSAPAPRPFAGRSWIETYATRLNGARAFLRSKGHSVSRASETMGTWHVTGFYGAFSDTDLFELAEMQGWQA